MAVDTAPTRQVEARERPAASRFTGWLRERGLLLLGIAFIIVYCLAPFYWMIVSSLKANPLLDQALVPTSPTLASTTIAAESLAPVMATMMGDAREMATRSAWPYPNESAEYRAARTALLAEEIEHPGTGHKGLMPGARELLRVLRQQLR